MKLKLTIKISLCLLLTFIFSSIRVNATPGNTLDGLGLNSSVRGVRIYSVRKLSSTYSGAAIRVRNANNSAEGDVAFDANGKISANSNVTITVTGSSGYSVSQVVSFGTFYSGADVYVTTWYDQSGFGANATQATASNQPNIVNAGVINVQNGQITIIFAGGSQGLSATGYSAAFDNSNGGTLCTVGRCNAEYRWQGLAQQGRENGTAHWGIWSGSDNLWTIGTRQGFNYYNIPSSTASNLFCNLSLVQTPGSTTNLFLKGNSIGNMVSRNLSNASNFTIGYAMGVSESWSGPVSEVLLFPVGVNSSTQSIIETNEQNFFTLGTSLSCSSNSSTTNITICNSQLPYTWNGLTFAGAGSQVAHLSNVGGCDSLATLNLTVNTPQNIGAVSGATSLCNGTTTTLSSPSEPTGGTITQSGIYRIHTFTGSGTFTVPAGFSQPVEVLVVAGGGSGGGNGGGGGGAGGVVYNSSYTLSGASTSITVGNGGAGSGDGLNAGHTGENSAFGALTALGGGGGASRDGGGAALAGGSGGGGGGVLSGNTAGFYGAAGTSGQGNNGGNGTGVPSDLNCSSAGGGGGGAGSAGGAGALNIAGNGGAGLAYSISGASTYYAAGGGGGNTCSSPNVGIGGSGIGGNGGYWYGGATSGAANTGSGGGGNGGSGAAGIVIVRYIDYWSSSNTSVATVDNAGVVTAVSPGTVTISKVVSGCYNITPLTLTVTSPSTSTTNTTICSSALPYHWNGLTFNAAGTQTAHITNVAGCDSAATLNLTVTNTVTPSVSIVASANPICESQSVTITATATNGGVNPFYSFYINGVRVQNTHSNTYTTPTSFTNNDVVYVELLAANTCQSVDSAKSNTVTMQVNNNVVPSVSIATASSTVCNGTSVTFTATPTNGGSSPSYQWKKNNINIVSGTSSYITSALVNGDVIKCVMTADNTCQTATYLTSNSIAMTVNNASTSTTNLTINSSQLPYSWNGLTFNAAGTQTAHLTNAVNCDSAATLNLTVNAVVNGNGLSFDGADDYVDIQNPAALQFSSTGTFTIEAWINPAIVSGGWYSIIDKSIWNNNQGLLVYINGGILKVTTGGNWASLVTTSISANTWTHIAITYNNGTWNLYKNGSLAGTSSGTPYVNSTSPFTLGMRSGNNGTGHNDPYNGLLDEVRFWNIERTISAIQNDMNCDVPQQTGLVAYYRLDQGVAGGTNTGLNTATDYSGNSLCATLNNFALSGSSSNWVTGSIGTCNAISATCTPNYVWTGATSTNWSVATNWTNNILPTPGVTVTIPSAPTNQPLLSTDVSIGGILLDGSVGFNGHSFTITGAITGTGIFNGSSTSTLVLNTSSNNTINFGTTARDSLLANLTISGSGTETIGTGIGITGILNVSAGTLNTGNHLTLKSTSISNTAVVDVVSGTIAGKVTVERFIPNGKRAFRDLCPEVANAGAIFSNWQESGNSPVGYGIYITGLKAAAPGGVDANTGLDKTQTGNPSLYNYGAGSWPSVTNTKNTNLDPFMGYRASIRGDRTYNIYIPDPAAMVSATTLRATGNLVTGNVQYTTSNVISSAFTSTAAKLVSGTNNYSFVANPYVCPIDWETIYTNAGTQNVSSSYWYFDPTFMMGGYATYVTYNAVNHLNNNPSASKLSRYIQPGMAFFVQNTGSTPALSITESNKAPNSTKTAVFKTTAPNYLHVSLWKKINGENTNIDGAVAAFNSDFTKVIGDKDSKKIPNGGENLFIIQSNTDLSIAGLPVPTEKEEILLNLNQLVAGTNYQLQLDASQFTTTGLEVFIKDKFLNTIVPAAEGINFTPTKDVATCQERFSVVFKAAKVNPIIVKGTISIYPNPAANGKFNLQMSNLDKGAYTVRVINNLGVEVMNSTISNESGSIAKTISTKGLTAGVYMVQVIGKTGTYNTEMIIK